ncbi:hypothetical protein PF010_g24908 [Phytophthora fragariae]|uniref:Secreted protein n=1 Tax=Phytophthora fragariae TaxID=53985 RepID=A0A6A3KF06_9STRA|nr:hypothetical protein PF011_g12496 [Phytophthora fragariae]KAE9073856.1 hypothetical protein PF010_g24908 [Phytophthora fragariae]
MAQQGCHVLLHVAQMHWLTMVMWPVLLDRWPSCCKLKLGIAQLALTSISNLLSKEQSPWKTSGYSCALRGAAGMASSKAFARSSTRCFSMRSGGGLCGRATR